MKKINLVLVIISLIIVIGACCYSVTLYHNHKSKQQITEKVEIDGSDATYALALTSEFLLIVLSAAIILYGLIAVGAIWAIYGIILLIMYLLKKYKSKRMDSNKVV